MNARVLAVEALERRIGHTFADRDLLERSLTHASVGDGAVKVRHNERLEFLGDRVLGLLASERLLALYPEAKEGELSPRLANLVNGKACARVVSAQEKPRPAQAGRGNRGRGNYWGSGQPLNGSRHSPCRSRGRRWRRRRRR